MVQDLDGCESSKSGDVMMEGGKELWLHELEEHVAEGSVDVAAGTEGGHGVGVIKGCCIDRCCTGGRRIVGEGARIDRKDVCGSDKGSVGGDRC